MCSSEMLLDLQKYNVIFVFQFIKEQIFYYLNQLKLHKNMKNIQLVVYNYI